MRFEVMQMNKCPYCGGQIVMEYFGDYGLVYKMKSNGEPSKKPIRQKKLRKWLNEAVRMMLMG